MKRGLIKRELGTTSKDWIACKTWINQVPEWMHIWQIACERTDPLPLAQ